jgi:hypothetical protein
MHSKICPKYAKIWAFKFNQLRAYLMNRKDFSNSI